MPVPFRLSVLNGSGRTHVRCYWTSGEIDDLDTGLRAWQGALRLIPAGEDRSGYLNNLGIGFSTRYERTGEIDDLEQAIRIFGQAVEEVDPESPDSASFLNHLAMAHRIRFERCGELADLERALDLAEKAVTRTPPSSRDLPARLQSRGLALQARYVRSGSPADLEGALRDFEQAVRRTPPDVPALAIRLSNLGTALGQRYERTGDLDDLERSGEAFERSVRATPPGGPMLGSHLNNLGVSLSHFFEHTRDAVHMDRAVEAFAAAVRNSPPEAHYFPRYVLGLVGGLLQRFESCHESDDVEQAIGLLEESLPRFAPEDPLRTLATSRLSEALARRFEVTGETRDLEAALERGREATAESAEDPQRPRYLAAFAAVLLLAQEHGHPQVSRGEVVRLYRQAMEEGFETAVEVSLGAAHFLGDWEFRCRAWAEAADAYRGAFRALTRLLEVLPVRPAREAWLRRIQGVTARAAYALGRAGDLPGAVAAFEDGHARLLAEASLHRRTALETLRRDAPELSERYVRTSERLAVIEQEVLRADSQAGRARVEELRCERSRLDAVLAQIRRRPGFEDFLRSPTPGEVQALLGRLSPRSALVYLAATAAGALAVVFTARALREVWLEITLDEILAFRNDPSLADETAPPEASPSLRRLLGTLPLVGERLVGPVAALLRTLDVEQVVLVPIGPLAALPLHAAPTASGHSLLDEWQVTFVPNARSLDAAWGELRRRRAAPYLVGVGDSQPESRPLRAAVPELEEVAGRFAGEARVTLCGEAATRAALFDRIGEATHLHLACHGRFDTGEPLASGLELAGSDVLSLRDVLHGEARLERTRLAVLSACESATSDAWDLPDELVGLPAGFLQAGVPGVVGTLWRVDDFSTALVMRQLYALHLGGGMAPAQALREAQRWLREVAVGELVGSLRTYRHEAGLSPGLRAFAARSLARLRPLPDSVTPFSHPYYWAAFVMVGV